MRTQKQKLVLGLVVALLLPQGPHTRHNKISTAFQRPKVAKFSWAACIRPSGLPDSRKIHNNLQWEPSHGASAEL